MTAQALPVAPRPAPVWAAASDGREHLVSIENLARQHVLCGAKVGLTDRAATGRCLGCRAVVLTNSADAPDVPTDGRRASRRCLHNRHRWLVTRCREIGHFR